MQAFQEYGGLASFIQQLETEVNVCRKEQPFVINPKLGPSSVAESQNAEATTSGLFPEMPDSPVQDSNSDSNSEEDENISKETEKECSPERANLLKKMLDLLKEFVLDSDSTPIRHLMDGTLPESLKHIISNAEYYGSSVFYLATSIVTEYLLEDPTLLPSFQDKGLTDAILHALLDKKVPAEIEVLASLGDVFSALCLNARGLQAFVVCKPFEKLFRVLVSVKYLPVMHHRRGSEPLGYGASKLGFAMDKLIKNQPSLRIDAIAAIIKLFEEICVMGRDPTLICSRPSRKIEAVTAAVTKINSVPNMTGYDNDDDDYVDDEEEEEEEEGGGVSASAPVQHPLPKTTDRYISDKPHSIDFKRVIPLEDYILNVMRFLDAFLTPNADNCDEFIRQKGLVLLMSILGLPNLPIYFPVKSTCLAVSRVCINILAQEPQILKEGLIHLNEVLQCLEPLCRPLHPPTNSVLLEEFNSFPNEHIAELIVQPTPLLNHMISAHAYTMMFVHLCQTGNGETRTILINHWGSELGLSVLKDLSSLYISLVWESTVLLNLSKNDKGSSCQFVKQQLQNDKNISLQNSSEFESNEVTSAMEALSTTNTSGMDIDNDGQMSSVKDTAENSSVDGKTIPKTHLAELSPLLLGSSSLCMSQALAELFRPLVKFCVGSSTQTRQRRGQQIPSLPSVPPTAHAVASTLTRLLKIGLSWVPSPAYVPKFRLTFYICIIRFASSMLFDETQFSYHLMLHKFLSSGGLDAFFNTFHWALTYRNTADIEKSVENSEIPDETTEFLDAWLMLLKKLVNPKSVLESPHTLPPKLNEPGSSSFNPVLYLIHIHKHAFESILCLWNRKTLAAYGKGVAESMLAVICHIVKGEKIIQEKVAKGEDTHIPAQGMSAAAAADVHPDHLTQLIDMGFTRSLATEALLNTNSLQQATDYLLMYPRYLSSGNSGALAMEWGMSENDQMQRAIALSLGENVSVSADQVESEQNKTEEKEEIEFEQQQEEALSSKVLDEFLLQIVDSCIHLADALPDTVYRCSDLLISVAARNGEEWRNKSLIDFLLVEIHSQIYYLLQHLREVALVEFDKFSFGSKMPLLNVETNLAVRLHLFALIFKELKIPCATRIEQKNLLPKFIKILEITSWCLSYDLDDAQTKFDGEQCRLEQWKDFFLKWLPFIILIIDQYEKVAIMSARKAPLLMVSKRQWKWFDELGGKWNNYILSNNKLIDDAYKSGDSILHITESRRNYTVCLTTMIETNEESGNKRPIMFTTDSPQEKEKDTPDKPEKKKEHESTFEDSLEEELPIDGSAQTLVKQNLHTQPIHMITIKGLTPEQCEKLVGFCVSLLQVPLEPDSVHAVMRLCLRLTRKHSNAVLFANMNGPKNLLSLTEPSRFPGFTSLTGLLFRHIMEDPVTLCSTMKEVIRSATVPGLTSKPFSKEMHNVFRELAPAACRDPELFTSVASSNLCMKILPLPPRREEEESRLDSYSVLILRSSSSKSQITENISNSEVAENLIIVLLNALTANPVELLEKASTTKDISETPVSTSDPESPHKNGSDGDLISTDDDLVRALTIPNVVSFKDSTEIFLSEGGLSKVYKGTANYELDSSTLKKTPIIKKSGICRLLAELVRSYPQCARLITDYSYVAENSESEVCSVLSFILDHLLRSETDKDKETPALARVLIAAISSCNHSIEAQTAVVLEVRSALIRALSLPENTEKHLQIQALSELISTMIESCPSASSQNQLGRSTLKTEISMNNIERIILENGIVMDLARIPHYLDLSSPHMAKTVNSALRPLEIISGKVNLSSGTLTNKAKSKAASSTTERDAVSESEGNTSSAHCSSDVPLSFPEDDILSQDISIDSTSENLHQDLTSSTLADLTVDSSEQELAFPMEVEGNADSQMRSQRSVSFRDTTNQDDQQEGNDLDSNSETTDDVDTDDDEVDEDDTPLFELLNDYPRFDFFSLLDHAFDNRNDNLSFQLQEIHSHARGLDPIRTYQLRVVADETANERANLAPTVLSAPRMAATIHPLLELDTDTQSPVQTRVHFHQGVHLHQGAHLHQGGLQQMMNRIATLPPDNSGSLTSIPATLNRWAEISRVLDGDSIHDCVIGLKPAIIKCLEAYMHEELSKRKEKIKKLQGKMGEKSVTSTVTTESVSSGDQNVDTQASMEVAEPSNVFENNALPADNMPTVNMPEENAPDQEAEIPEGVDPSFLAALPHNIREEVIAEQLRLQRLRRGSLNISNDNTSEGTSFTEVNPEFLAALPANIQEEVLADMEDRLLNRLRPAASSEAEANRALSHLLRSASRFVSRYTIESPHRGHLALFPQGTSTPSGNASRLSRRALSNSMKLRGHFLLDHEALTCLLVLLFVDDSDLNIRRLYRVLKNLCHHGTTRNWVIKALLSILERTKVYQLPEIQLDSDPHKEPSECLNFIETNTTSSKRKHESSSSDSQRTWLSISLDVALNCRTNVFQIQRHHRTSKKHSSYATHNALNPGIPLVTIHPAASPIICRHVLDMLISFAKSFPIYFLPDISKEKKTKVSNKEEQKSIGSASSSNKIEEKTVKSELSNIQVDSDFWDILIKLDSLNSTSSKGKSILRNYSSSSFGSSPGSSDEESKIIGFESSPLAQLMGLLAHPIVKSSRVLTDRLLKLLALISHAFPESHLKSKSHSDFCQQSDNKDYENTCMSPIHEEVVETTTGTTDDPISYEVEQHHTVKDYLKLAVEVFSSKTCSEEGFVDATSFLLAFSRGGGCNRTRRTLLFLLLDGAKELGSVVLCDILALMHELKCNFADKALESCDKELENDEKFSVKGTIRDRYTNSAVVITDPVKSKGKGRRGLQLPAMRNLTSKTSSQAFFLFILKITLTVLTESKHLGKNKEKEPKPKVADNSGDENLNSGPLSSGEASSSTIPSQSTMCSPILQEIACIHLSSQLRLDKLWDALSDCLSELAKLPDHLAVLDLQPAVEAFFLVHAPSDIDKKKVSYTESRESEMSHIQDMPHASPLTPLLNPTDKCYGFDSNPSGSLPSDTVNFLAFAETHKTILNQILRQSPVPLAVGPFSVLLDHTKILDFDIKRQHFRHQLRIDSASRRDDLTVHVRREHVFEDSYRELHHRRPEEWKNSFHIEFEGEEGEDAGGLLREWYTIIAREIFNPMYALFTTSPGDRVTYMINSSSHCNPNHLSYFKFVGRVIAKAVYDNKLLESYFTRSFYKHILGKCVKYTDMESEDYSFYQGLVFLFEHSVEELGYELTFSAEVQEFGVTDIRDLKPNGRNLRVCEENKHEYVKLVCQEKMTGAIRQQLKSFLQGFYEIIPKKLISIFNEQELELLISGLPNIDIDDLKANTEYHKYQPKSLQIQWLWRALRSFDQADRAKFLQFVTGTSKVPLQGFSALEGMTGIQKFHIHRDDRSTDRLPSAHTCFNQLDLPAYETYDKLHSMLLKAIHECSEGFGFA